MTSAALALLTASLLAMVSPPTRIPGVADFSQSVSRARARATAERVYGISPSEAEVVVGTSVLTYFGARYYDARTARWISTDADEGARTGKRAGKHLSLYSYAFHNPLALVDPDGNDPAKIHIIEAFRANPGAYTADELEHVHGFSPSPQDFQSEGAFWAWFDRETGGITRNPHSDYDPFAEVWTFETGAALAVGVTAGIAAVSGALATPRQTPRGTQRLGPAPPAARGPRIEMGKQGKHIPGHRNYIPGRSPFTHKDPQGLVNRFAGKGQQAGNVPRGQAGFKERVDFEEVIGEHGGQPTTMGIIHYSKNGAHIVPARPAPTKP